MLSHIVNYKGYIVPLYGRMLYLVQFHFFSILGLEFIYSLDPVAILRFDVNALISEMRKNVNVDIRSMPLP